MGHTTFGVAALGLILLAVYAAVFIFQWAKIALKLHFILNLPGSFFCFAGVLTFTYWMASKVGLFNDVAPMNPQMPEVSGWIVLEYLALFIGWYIAMPLFQKWADKVTTRLVK